MHGPNFKETLSRSLARQRKILGSTVILTPVDSIPLFDEKWDSADFLHGFYISDKQRTREQQKQAVIQFPGRDRATRDINLIHRRLAQMLGGAEASLRLLSGLHAHIVVFMSLAAIGDTVMLLPQEAGGHFAAKGILERLGLRVIEMAVDIARRCVDQHATLALIRRKQPKFIFLDRSEGLRYEDFSFLGEVNGPVKIFDASHYLPQIMSGNYTSPFRWGFDLLVFTLHKSFPGPQKAGIAARESTQLWSDLMKGVGELVSSSHSENSYRTGIVLADECKLQEYTCRLLDTALALEENLCAAGIPVFRRCDQGQSEWPPTHHVWIPLESNERAFSVYRGLAQSRIHANYRLLPYELGWGLRLGTTAAVICGLRRESTKELADIITEIYCRGFTLRSRHKVRELCQQMHRNAFCSWPNRD